ncbi:unnamed protein product [Allacma fusca]|uniref:Phospholipid-transporting ATPase n=1 Tax=Allacma fusca TaxID=39272 RepID=A0A8J2J285_9HEXA|nr:unnamed protein product [Allacma fusca]
MDMLHDINPIRLHTHTYSLQFVCSSISRYYNTPGKIGQKPKFNLTEIRTSSVDIDSSKGTLAFVTGLSGQLKRNLQLVCSVQNHRFVKIHTNCGRKVEFVELQGEEESQGLLGNSDSNYRTPLLSGRSRRQRSSYERNLGETSSSEEEFGRVTLDLDRNRATKRSSRKNMLRNGQRSLSVSNPNYDMTINMGDEEEGGSSSDGVNFPSHVGTPDDYRRHSSRLASNSNGLARCIGGIGSFACWFCSKLSRTLFRKKELRSREFTIGKPTEEKHAANIIRNQKYNVFSFIPLVLYQQFKFFLNLYFLIMATSQFFQSIRIGYWYTYWGPLIFVLSVTLIRELIDDIRRRQRDKEINNQKYHKITREGQLFVPSSKIKVGDLIMVEKNQRVPADMVLLRTSDKAGRCFVRTDQLDGETDWKLRLPILQELEHEAEIFTSSITVYAEKPQKDIHSFVGTMSRPRESDSDGRDEIGIQVENTLWANTVLAAGNAVGVVVYTGKETRSVMNNSIPRSKVGLIDLEVNNLTKILFLAVIGLAFLMMCLKGFEGPWYRYMFRFVLLFSYIIPISLRVNLDMAKAFYATSIQKDKSIAGTVARSTTISEDLGRISYLLTDKTGTLTQNEMVFKRLCLANSQADSIDDIRDKLKQAFRTARAQETVTHMRIDENIRVKEAIKALGVCHNVTPVCDENEDDQEMAYGIDREFTYQASSPDEIALVKYVKDVGLSLVQRDQSTMTLKSFDDGITLKYQILHVFPFTSEAKRMGIIVKTMNEDLSPGARREEIIFYQKGADVVMKNIVKYTDWMDESLDNMSREGLRTLVVAKKTLTQEQYDEFDKKYNAAKSSKVDRPTAIAAAVNPLEDNMDLVCVTGVEDTLQEDVKVTLETLRNAQIKIWMLTGDKLETAICIAKSSKLVATQQDLYVFKEIADRAQAFTELNNYRRKSDQPIVIKGESLDVCLQYYEREFMELACGAPVVVVCRCSPTQKAKVVELVQKSTNKRTAAIGDGGNDVAMIQAADVGIGIEGKEGRQASLAADFSIPQFRFVSTLLLVHGRYSYKRSASLAQFVMHRGLIITVMQAVFSSIFYFSSVALYQGLLMIGYATLYTMFPVFALVLDQDVRPEDLLRLPELYAELGKGRSLTYKTFFLWVLVSVYQGGMIMYGALILFKDEFIHIVSISFTSLILTELIMVGITIRTMHRLMILAEVVSFLTYVLSLFIFHGFFDINFILTWTFLWKVTLITTCSCLPICIFKYVGRCIAPPNYSKLG